MIDYNSWHQIVSIAQCRKMRVKCYLIAKSRTRLGGNVFWRVRFYHPFFSSRYSQMRDPNTSTLPGFPQKQKF